MIKTIKNSILNIFKTLAGYNSIYQEFQENLKEINELMNNNPLFKNFLHAIKWKEYIKINNIDSECLMKSTEFARKEIETFSLTSTTVIAALVAAVISSLVNLFFKFF